MDQAEGQSCFTAVCKSQKTLLNLSGKWFSHLAKLFEILKYFPALNQNDKQDFVTFCSDQGFLKKKRERERRVKEGKKEGERMTHLCQSQGDSFQVRGAHFLGRIRQHLTARLPTVQAVVSPCPSAFICLLSVFHEIPLLLSFASSFNFLFQIGILLKKVIQ